ncbi:VOC family protein [Streptomyces sp. NPDC004539]|uniref:VOC family protein n=1 Tax=Streptomyces sp. NPDC004539 TaxID=3154280 RepID=UPI0033A61206
MNLFHTGIVVPDIEAWKTRLTATAGHRWTRTLTGELRVRLADGDHDLTLTYAYSLDAPHLELVQEIPGTPWRAGAHHIGYLCDDLHATSKRLEADGWPREACAVLDGEPAIFAYHLDPAGVRVELVDRARVPDFPAYLRARTPR